MRFALNAILAFWIAYILTRPLGASIGDYLSQPKADGGLGLGTTVTSVVFLLTILGVVAFLTVTRRDRIEATTGPYVLAPPGLARILVVANKTTATPALVEAVRERAATGPAEFVMLVPNPAHLPFDRPSADADEGERLLEESLPALDTRRGHRDRGPCRQEPERVRRHRRGAWSARIQRDHPRDDPGARLALAARRPATAARGARLPADDDLRHALSGRMASR